MDYAVELGLLGANPIRAVKWTAPKVLTRLPRQHLASFVTNTDSRLFGGVRGGELPTITYRRAWVQSAADGVDADPAEFTARAAPRRPPARRQPQITALDRTQPHILAASKDLEIAAFLQVIRAFLGGAAGTRTQDRRIMSPLL